MIPYLPEVYPDELVYSWFCRCYVHLGYFNHNALLQELYCKRSDNPSKEFIGNLKPGAREIIGQMILLDDLVLKHTMYPQYARFIPMAQKWVALHRLGHESCDPHHLFCILPRDEGEQYLRYCPLCVQEDRERFGEAYWHRKHQIRGVHVCVRHACRLRSSGVSSKSEQNYTFYPAEDSVCDGGMIILKAAEDLRFAEYAVSVFEMPMDFVGDVPACAVLYDAMSRTKYLKVSGKCRYTRKLAEEMGAFYGGIGLKAASMHQVQRALLGERYDFSVICQIGFFLGITPEDLANPSLSAELIQQERESHYVKNASPVDWERLDRETVPVLEKKVKGIYSGAANENGRPERVSERLVYREIGLKAHQLENMPMCRAVFEKYAESYPESRARKIIWAYRKLKEHGKGFYWSDIRNLSGVKKDSMCTAIPFLKVHANAEEVQEILNLAGAKAETTEAE